MTPTPTSYADAATSTELGDKVFYDENGKMYKAKAASSPTHSECNFPTEDMLAALTNIPISREQMIAKINHPEFKKKNAVLAKEDKK